MENNVTTNSLRAWLLAARPKTLAGAAVPVMIGVAMAIADTSWHINVWAAVLCFLFAFIMQIDANFVNDYFDFVRGNDDETRLGPPRACAQGWTTVGAMRRAIILTTAVGCLVGLPLAWIGGWQMVAVGALCVAFCVLYTTTLSYMGLGDVLVLVFFGLVPVCLTYYLSVPDCANGIGIREVTAAVASGLIIDLLLVINNYRDIDNDRRAGKLTLIVKIGAERGRLLYLALGYAACLLGVVHIIYNNVWAFVLPLLFLLPHTLTYRRMVKIEKGCELNRILGETARNMFIYGTLTTIGLLL